MRQRSFKIVLCLLFIIFLGACDPVGTIQDSGKITGIFNDEIANHGSKQISCYVLDPKSGEYNLRVFCPNAVKRIPDLQPGERVWIRCRKYKLDGDRFLSGTMEIHCHPEKMVSEISPPEIENKDVQWLFPTEGI